MAARPAYLLLPATACFLALATESAGAQRGPSASTCDIVRRQGRTIPGCAARPAPSAPRTRDARRSQAAPPPAPRQEPIRASAPRLTRAALAMRDALDALPAATWSRSSDFMELEMRIDQIGSAADLRTLANTGHGRALVILGLAYQYDELGLGTDSRQACRFYERAAEAGDVQGQLRAGMCYSSGLSVQRDYARARQLLELASAQGNRAATSALGSMYRDGLGVARDNARAEELFRRAAAMPQ